MEREKCWFCESVELLKHRMTKKVMRQAKTHTIHANHFCMFFLILFWFQ